MLDLKEGHHRKFSSLLCFGLDKKMWLYYLVQFSFIKRDGNSALYILSKYAKFVSDITIWLEDTQNFDASSLSI